MGGNYRVGGNTPLLPFIPLAIATEAHVSKIKAFNLGKAIRIQGSCSHIDAVAVRAFWLHFPSRK